MGGGGFNTQGSESKQMRCPVLVTINEQSVVGDIPARRVSVILKNDTGGRGSDLVIYRFMSSIL